MIVEALRGVGRPVSAYELIDSLREKATLAPQTVYRSLDRLIADGQAHRLESLNAFVACRHPAHEGAAVFAICDDCGIVTEFESRLRSSVSPHGRGRSCRRSDGAGCVAAAARVPRQSVNLQA
jgi:Fe2+ or Zn2+ uptake regulation protein